VFVKLSFFEHKPFSLLLPGPAKRVVFDVDAVLETSILDLSSNRPPTASVFFRYPESPFTHSALVHSRLRRFALHLLSVNEYPL